MTFDVDTYSRVGGRLELDGVDLVGGFTDCPLTSPVLRCLQYMHDVEHHTACYLRDLLVTKAHADPEITTFLTIWNYEEHWHGEAIGQVLAAHGCPNGTSRIREIRKELRKADRWRPVGFIIGSGLVPDMVAIHMVWGAINEWTTQAGYSLLSRKAGHPVLSELLRRIMKQEGRHIDFYAGEARRRLERSRASQRVTRFALERFWKPVGHGVRPEEEARFLVRYLFDGEAGTAAVDRIDRNVGRLPGLGGLHLLATAIDQYRAA